MDPDAALFHDVNVLRQGESLVNIMLNDQDTHALVACLDDGMADHLRHARAQALHWFIHENETRLHGERTAHSEHLLLTAAKASPGLHETFLKPREQGENPV